MPVLEPAENAFDDVALTIGPGVEGMDALAGWVVGDDWNCSPPHEELAQAVTVIGGVGGQEEGWRQGRDQARCDADIS
jgi:hypothetical protein